MYRVYAEPHEVDIDIYLEQVYAHSDPRIIYMGITFSDEETFFLELQAGTYQLFFLYISSWSAPLDCPTFNFEIEISPTTSLTSEINRLYQ